MIIKSINKTIGYKGLPDGFRMNFDEKVTYIVGDNFKTKSTILSVPLWVLTGYNMKGNNQEDVSDDRRSIRDVIAEITIIDNDGVEHVISRTKGKNNFTLLDGVRATKETMGKYYKDIPFFLCAYNPYRFSTLEKAKQRELLLRLLPSIEDKDAFNLLSEEDKKIIGEPIVDNTTYCKDKRAEIKKDILEMQRLQGIVDSNMSTALMQEQIEKTFNKETKLRELKEQYEKMLTKSDEYLNISDLQMKISKLSEKINSIIHTDLEKIKKEKEDICKKIEDVSSISSKCPTCRQEIKNKAMQEALKVQYNNNLDSINNNMENMKNEAKNYLKELKEKQDIYNKLNSAENIKIQNKIEEIKNEIAAIENEKHEIDLYNQEIISQRNAIRQAKEKVNIANNGIDEIEKEIELFEKQIKIANKQKILIINEQLKGVEGFFDNVCINLFSVDPVTEDVQDDYYITYKGRDYYKLSQSEKMRADFELANFINKQSGINTPVFIDDTERIRDIKFNDDVQIVIALYIKYSELNILYDYNEVLRNKKESIENQLKHDDEFVYLNAA